MNDVNFATQEADGLIRDLQERYMTFLGYRKSHLEPRWNVNRDLYYNADLRTASTPSGIAYDGQQGEIVRGRINHYRNLVLHTLNLIIGAKPSFSARATNTEGKSLQQAKLANNLMDYYAKEKNLTDVLKRALEEALIHDAGYVSVTWDPGAGKEYAVDMDQNTVTEGDVLYRNLSPYEVFFDLNKRAFSDNDWIMTYAMRSRFDLAAQFPDLADDILKINTGDTEGARIDSTDLATTIETDDVQVFEFYHKKTSSLPMGRYVMFAGDVVLYDAELPYRELPIYQVTAGRHLTSQFGYSVANDLVPIQTMHDDHLAAINSNHDAFGIQRILLPKGTGISTHEIRQNLAIIEYDAMAGGQPPSALNLCNTPPEMFNMLAKFESAMETVSGINSVVRGEATAGVTSGTALALLQNQSLSFADQLQENYVKMAEDVSTATIRLLRDFANSPRVVAIVGKNNEPAMKDFNGDDLQNVNRVMVELGNPLSRTVAGRLELANNLVQTGLIKQPEHYLEVLETGNLDVLTEAATGQLSLIRGENELMMDGQQTQAMITDDHKLHINEHAAILNNPILRQDDNLCAGILNHIQAHIQFMQDPNVMQLSMQLGHQVIAPPPAPMPGPTPPVHGTVHPSVIGPAAPAGLAPGQTPPNLPQPAHQPAHAIQRPGVPQQ